MKPSFVLVLMHAVLVTSLAASVERPMPTAGTVGPAAMSAQIAAVDPPFDMPQPQRPQFAERSVNIVDRGAGEADTRHRPIAPGAGSAALVTPIIQQAIDEVSAAGGGTVVIPPGKWLTGRIILKSGVNLHVADGAELRFSGRIEDYLPAVFTRYEGVEVMSVGGMIYAHQQSNIAVTGGGTLVGPDGGPLREARPGLVDTLVLPTTPVRERVFDGQEGRHYFRPNFICPVDCQRVLVEGVTLRHGPMWNVVPIVCDGVIIRGVSIDSRGVVNGDGIDIVASRNVLVEYCSVSTGDDCYVLKAGRSAELLPSGRPVENVVMRSNHASGGFGGVTCGSETGGGIRNIYVHDCVFENVLHCVYLKTRRPRTGGGEHLLVERVVFSAYNHAICFDMLGAPIYVGELAHRLPPRPLTPRTPFYRDVTLRRLQGRSAGDALKVKGIPESPATRLVLENVDIRCRGLVNLADVQDVSIRDSHFESDSPEIKLLDARRVQFERVRIATAGLGVTIDVRGAGSREIVFDHCDPPLDQCRIVAGDGAESDAVSGGQP